MDASRRSTSAASASRSASPVVRRSRTCPSDSSNRERSRSCDASERRYVSISARCAAASSARRRRSSSASRRASAADANAASAASSSRARPSSSSAVSANRASSRRRSSSSADSRAPRLVSRGHRLPGLGLELDRAPELELGRGLGRLRLDERRLGLLQGPDGPGAFVGRGRDAPVERVEPFARGGPARDALVPPFLAPLALVPQVAQPRGRQPDGDRVGLRREGLVPLGHLGLLAERLQLTLELGEHVLEPEHVLVEPGQLAFGAFLALAVLGDPGRLLDVGAPVLRAGGQHVLELALPDHGVERAPDPGLGQQLLHVEEPDDLAADPVLALAGAEDRAADLDLGHRDRDQPRRVVDHELDLGHPERGPLRAAGEDHVGHLAAAERPGSLLAEHPADRVDEVRLARAVGSHDDGDARSELEDGLVGERLEASDVQGAEEHRRSMLTVALRPAGHLAGESSVPAIGP